MTAFHLDRHKRNKLIKDIQEFVWKETNVQFNEAQASTLFDSILDKVACDIYDQATFEVRCDLLQKTETLLGIEKSNLN